MKVLILTCSTGGGHNSAAGAIKSKFEEAGVECDVKDALELGFFSDKKSKAMKHGHEFVYRHMPKLFGAGYRFEEKHSVGLIYSQCALFAPWIRKHIEENGYDTVICVHVLTGMAMDVVQKKYDLNVKVYFVATDYTCSPGVNRGKFDLLFIPSGLKDEFVRCGLDESRLVESGIPVSPNFYERTDKAEARRRLGLPQDKTVILMMCGSMGCGPMEKLSEELSVRMPQSAQLCVICGSNRRLKRSIDAQQLRNTVTVGYTKRMSLYMDASDVMITKPGGLSSTEAIVKRLPIVFIDAVPGCETRNLDFLVGNGYALTGRDVPELAQATMEMILDEKKRKVFSELLMRDFDYNAAQIICERVIGEAK